MKKITKLAKYIAAALAATFCLTLAAADFAYANGEFPIVPEPTEKPISVPRVKLANPTAITVRSGRTERFDLTIRNVGSSFANSVLTQITPGAEAPFTIQIIDNSNITGALYEGNTKRIIIEVTADADAKSGAYPVTLTHSFKNAYNENEPDTSDTLLVRVESPSAAPNVALHSFTTDNTDIAAGDAFTVTAILENTSTMNASEVQVLIEGLEPEKINIAGESKSMYFSTYSAHYQQYVSFDLLASEALKKGTYPIVFKVTFKDSANQPLENSYTYYVNVGTETAESEDRARLSSGLLSAPSGTFDVGEEFSITVPIQNNGELAAKNVKVTAASGTEGAVVPKTSSVQQLASLEAGASEELTFTFAPTKDAVSQNYAISFKVEYETGALDGEDKPVVDTFEQFAGVNVVNSKADEEEEGEDGAKTSKPKIIVSAYESNPIIVAAGSEFDLKLVLQNAHSTKSVSNIKVTLTAVETTDTKGSVFTPVNGSNTFFVDSIAPKGTAEKTIRMFTVPDASPRNYSIQVGFKYEDGEFNEYEETELIGINVKQVTRLETSDFEVQPQSTVGTPVYLWFNIINSGKVALSNIWVTVEGEFDTTNANMYIGSINKTTSAYYDGNFVTNTPGTHQGRIVITCEDETGEPLELVAKEFTIEVTDMAEMDGMGMGGMAIDSETGMPMPGGDFAMPEGELGLAGRALALVKNPYVWGGAAVALIIIVLVARKIIARKKEMDFDD